ncbi:MAG: ABC transporter substrate-binding protein, partial [Bradyrhizobium sp.]|nr:ABC transporter substrate-binding protein [Bradyrhizobium sp.]
MTSFAVLLGLSQAAQADILVGFVTGLSGPVSSIGIPNAKGIAAGQAYVGEIGGEKVRVIQLDDGSDPTASTRNARKLAEQDKVDILIGTSGAPQTLAMATAAIEMKVPMIAVSPIAPVPSGDGGPWVVQTPQPTPLLVQGIVDHMKARGLKSVAFIGFSDAFGDLMYESLSASAKAADIKVVANERYARSDSSVTAQLLRALAARPDAIMLGGTGTP